MSMISCPRCGNRVSTMAGTCPHCGTAIAGHLKKCPTCGGHALTEQAECPHCQAPIPTCTTVDAPHRVTTPGASCQPDITPPTASTQPAVSTTHTAQGSITKKEKRNGKRKALWILIFSLFLIAIAAYALIYYQQLTREEEEFQRLTHATNPKYYEQFLIAYPHTKHRDEVTRRMTLLAQENSDWLSATQCKQRDSLILFAETYPHSVRLRLCTDMIDSIDWDEAQQLDTDSAIARYLQLHPQGRYTAEATARQRQLQRMQVSGQERSLIIGILEAFFTQGIAGRDTNTIAAHIPGAMEQFCDLSHATPQQIADWAQAKREKDVIALHYVISPDIRILGQEQSDGQKAYAIQFEMDETISRTDSSQPQGHHYCVTALLQADHKLLRMSIK